MMTMSKLQIHSAVNAARDHFSVVVAHFFFFFRLLLFTGGLDRPSSIVNNKMVCGLYLSMCVRTGNCGDYYQFWKYVRKTMSVSARRVLCEWSEASIDTALINYLIVRDGHIHVRITNQTAPA